VAVSLRTASGGAVSGMEESALRALTKLQQVLPRRLAHRVDALQSHTARVAPYSRGPVVDGDLLTLLANAARDRELVRFDYSDRSGAGSERKVEPYRLVNWGRRWYLVAFDPQRDDWRTFRADRLKDTRSTGHRFRLRDLPTDDIAQWVASRIRAVQQQVYAKVLVHLPAQDVVARMGPWLEGGGVEPRDDGSCLLTMGAPTHADLAFWIGVLDADFEVVDSPELAAAVERLADRYTRAAG
jgi:predicted DNA-binding transcriptional regulator YafY